MKYLGLLLAAISATLAIGFTRAQAAQTVSAAPGNCSTDFAAIVGGRGCTTGGAPQVYGDDDYATVFLTFHPPSSVTKDELGEYQGGFKKWLQQYFFPKSQAGQLVLKIYKGNSNSDANLLSTVPVSSFTIDEKNGISVAQTFKFGEATAVTPYFRVQEVQSLTLVFELQSSSTVSATLLTNIQQVAKAAGDFGGHGWLLKAVSNDGTMQALTTIQSNIMNSLGMQTKVSAQGALSLIPVGDKYLIFQYDFHPKATEFSGYVSAEVQHLPSIFTPDWDTGAAIPSYHTNGGFGTLSTYRFTNHSVSQNQTTPQAIATAAGNNYAIFTSSSQTADKLATACTAVKEASKAPSIGLNAFDSVAMFWASYVSENPNATDAMLRKSDCINYSIPDFDRLGLKLPATKASVVQRKLPDSGGATADKGNKTKVTTKEAKPSTPGERVLTTVQLKDYLDNRVGPRFALPTSLGQNKVVLLSELFSASGVQFNTGLPITSLNVLNGNAPGRAIANALEPMDLRAGCGFRSQPDNKIHFLVRANQDGTSQLWAATAVLSNSQAKALPDNVLITALKLDVATDSDLEATTKALPDRTDCRKKETALTQ